MVCTGCCTTFLVGILIESGRAVLQLLRDLVQQDGHICHKWPGVGGKLINAIRLPPVAFLLQDSPKNACFCLQL